MIINFDLTLNILEIIGIIAFSASGTFKGLKKEFDIFGIIVLALITATGGGIIRVDTSLALIKITKSPYLLSPIFRFVLGLALIKITKWIVNTF